MHKFKLKIQTMKKNLILIILLVTYLGMFNACCQHLPIYPIPSFNIEVNPYATFRENQPVKTHKSPMEKREVNVEVKTVSGGQNCQATVWIYSLDQTTVLGPYSVSCEEILSVAVDYREWGVLVDSEEEIVVSVWFTGDPGTP
jgi:hypothetical protein